MPLIADIAPYIKSVRFNHANKYNTKNIKVRTVWLADTYISSDGHLYFDPLALGTNKETWNFFQLQSLNVNGVLIPNYRSLIQTLMIFNK